MISFLRSKIVNHTISFTPIKKEEITMRRVSLGKSLKKDKDPVCHIYIKLTPNVQQTL